MRLAAVVVMVAASLAAIGSPVGAAATPTDLVDIDVARYDTYPNEYVVAALRKGGYVYAEVVSCSGDLCQKHGWTYLGKGLYSIQIERSSYGDVVVLGRAPSGKTWYRRGQCSNNGCVWAGWKSLGGKLRSVRSEGSSGGCVNVAGLSSTDRVYRAKICENGTAGWSYAHGKLKQMEVDSDGDIFGTSSSGNLWWNRDNVWHNEGGNLTQPVNNYNYVFNTKCGLSPGSRQLWCITEGYNWGNLGGYFRKLDDGQTIGVAANWSAQEMVGSTLRNHGGSVNQVAADQGLWVGVSGGKTAWYHNSNTTSNGWYRL